MGLKDGLGFEEVNQPGASTAIVSATTFSGTDFVNGDGLLKSSKAGTSFGATVQGGSAALGAGSNAWVVFSTAYTGVPAVVATDVTTAGQALLVGSIVAGSFYVEGPTASDEFSWVAVGL